jgi:hypothetical protein
MEGAFTYAKLTTKLVPKYDLGVSKTLLSLTTIPIEGRVLNICQLDNETWPLIRSPGNGKHNNVCQLDNTTYT